MNKAMHPAGTSPVVYREGKYFTFSLCGEEYGIGVLTVKEIIGLMRITSVPQTTEDVN